MKTSVVLTAVLLAVMPIGFAFAETSDSPDVMWACQEPDGTTLYTNKERPGCQTMTLKPLGVMPDLAKMHTIPPATMDAVHRDSMHKDRTTPRADRSVPDWARGWYSSIAPSGSVQEEVCSLYSEWMHLVQKTRGGMFFGSDPSYGGDITGRNERSPSYSYFDNTRYLTLSRLFGRGFIPIGCD